VTGEQLPRPTASVAEVVDVDAGLRLTRRIVFVLCVVVVVLLSIVVYLVVRSSTENTRVEHDVRTTVVSSCAFYHDIATVKVVPQSTLEGVKIVLDARRAYNGLSCNTPLPAPQRLLDQLARKYHLGSPLQ
jgi:hypothetical protein